MLNGPVESVKSRGDPDAWWISDREVFTRSYWKILERFKSGVLPRMKCVQNVHPLQTEKVIELIASHQSKLPNSINSENSRRFQLCECLALNSKFDCDTWPSQGLHAWHGKCKCEIIWSGPVPQPTPFQWSACAIYDVRVWRYWSGPTWPALAALFVQVQTPLAPSVSLSAWKQICKANCHKNINQDTLWHIHLSTSKKHKVALANRTLSGIARLDPPG